MRYIFIALFISLFSCKGTQESSSNLTADSEKNTSKLTTQTVKTSVKTYQELATEKLGKENIQYKMNGSKTLVLCKVVKMTKNIPMSPAGGKAPAVAASGSCKLIVVNIEKGKVIFEKSIAFGNADWASDTELHILEVQGAYMPGKSGPYLYDVIKGMRVDPEKKSSEKP